MRNYNLTTFIPARKKAEFMRKAENMESKKEIFNLAKETAIFYGQKHQWTFEECKTVSLSLYACGLCVYNMKHSETVFDFLKSYVAWKHQTFLKLSDFGAFADSVETTVHLIACRKVWRASKKVLHVASIGKTDIIINGVKYEIGINGKTWNDSIEDNPMNGPFTGVIYGVFSEEEMKTIIHLFRYGDHNKAIKTIANMLYVFPDKEEFYTFMNGISRGKGIAWKEHIAHYQTIYNSGKHAAFIKAIERSNYKTLAEHMNDLSDNDFTAE